MKKTLVVFLAVMMVLAFAVSAMAYTDDGSINQDQAVGVLSGMTVIDGFPDGTFQPQGTLTRAQAAKLIYVMFTGEDDEAAALKGTVVFPDVPGTHWASGYIAWASAEGLIVGMGDGKFYPEALVTGTQLAKMILCALGYDQQAEGYTGSNWAANVLAKARNLPTCEQEAYGTAWDDYHDSRGKFISLFAELKGLAANNALQREQAAQMLFNALSGAEITYDGQTSIVINDINITSKGSRVLGECLYLGLWEDLEATDGFNKLDFPAWIWEYQPTEFEGTYAKAADYSFVVDDEFDFAEAIDDFKALTLDFDNDGDIDTTFSLNGESASDATDLGMGDVVYLYCDGKQVDYAVALRYTAVQIDDVEDVDTDIKADKTAKEDGAAKKLTLTDVGIGADADEDVFYDIDIPGYIAASYTKGAYILAIFGTEGSGSDAELQVWDSYLPTLKEGKITSYASDYLKLAGTKHSFAVLYDNDFNDAPDFDEEYNVYVDANGYAAYAEGAEAGISINDFYFVARTWETTGRYGGTVRMAELVALDGTVREVQLTANSTAFDQRLVNVEEDDDDEDLVTLKIEYNVDGTDYRTVPQVAANNVPEFKTSSTSITAGGYRLRLNSSTQYLTVKAEPGKALVVKTYTGGINLDTDAGYFATILTVDGSNNIANYVFYWNNASISIGGDKADDLYYIKSGGSPARVGSDKYEYTVYKSDGSTDAIVTKHDSRTSNKFYSYEQMDGYIKLTEEDALVFTANDEWDDDITGVFYEADLFDVYVDGKTISVYNGAAVLSEIDADQVTIVDIRTDEARSGDLYKSVINTLGRLNSAFDGGDTDISIDISINEEGAVLIFIRDVEDVPAP